MEGVEDWRLDESLDREGEVNECEYEATVLHQETQTDPLLLEVDSNIAEVGMSIFNKGVMIGALRQQKHSSGL